MALVQIKGCVNNEVVVIKANWFIYFVYQGLYLSNLDVGWFVK